MALALRASISPDRAQANPGDALTVEVTVRNTSDVVEHYVIDMLGLPEGSTARAEPEVTKLRPGETGTATVRFDVPGQPPAEAGLYTVGVLVRSRYREEVSRCEELPLTVAPTQAISVRVEPEVANGRRSAQYGVEVANGGNTPARLRLNSTDPERKVSASFHPPTMYLPPGAAARALLDVHAPRPWSKEKQRTLTVEAAGEEGSGTASATFVQRPRFASKLARMAGVLGAVLVLAGAVVGAAIIANANDDKPETNPSEAASGGPNPSPPGSPSAPVSPSAPGPASPTAPVSPSAVGPASPSATPAAPPSPQQVDLAVAPPNTMVPSDAFGARGITIGGLPGLNPPPGCSDATAVFVRDDGAGGRYLTAGLPQNANECAQVPVWIQFNPPVASVKVTLGGQGARRMEASYQDLTRTVERDMVADDNGRGGIVYVTIGPEPGDQAIDPPKSGVRSVTFTPAAG